MLFAGLGCLAAAAAKDTVAGSASPASSSTNRPGVILAVGAGGEPEYAKQFAEWAGSWQNAAQAAGANFAVIGLDEADPDEAGARTDLTRLRELLESEPKESPHELWIVLIGHGTFDGHEAKFNLRGPDLTAFDLSEWLKGFQRPLALINVASASGPFLTKLSGTNRVVVTATRSGHEQNYARFGKYFSEAFTNLEADLDKDGQVSLIEAYLVASRSVSEFYDLEGRLATEHALLDDNGDGLGTPADWFRGVRAVKKAKEGAALDGFRAHQFHLVRNETERRMSPEVRQRRDELERQIFQLREEKAQFKEDEYYGRLEPLLVEMAELYEKIDVRQPGL